MPPTLHHLNNSQSLRILWLCEELRADNGFAFTLRRYTRVRHRAPPELLAVHPLGKAPVLEDDGPDGEHLVLPESNAIAAYLLGRYDRNARFAPRSTAVDRVWMDFAAASLQPLVINLLLSELVPRFAPVIIRQLLGYVLSSVDARLTLPELAKLLRHLEASLPPDRFLMGGEQPTGADFGIEFSIELLAQRGTLLDRTRYPKINAWHDRVQARPAYQAAIANGGTYDLTFKSGGADA